MPGKAKKELASLSYTGDQVKDARQVSGLAQPNCKLPLVDDAGVSSTHGCLNWASKSPANTHSSCVFSSLGKQNALKHASDRSLCNEAKASRVPLRDFLRSSGQPLSEQVLEHLTVGVDPMGVAPPEGVEFLHIVLNRFDAVLHTSVRALTKQPTKRHGYIRTIHMP
ncbi:hypothetical protein [Cupriavidus necator]